MRCPKCARGEVLCYVCKGSRKDPRDKTVACTYCRGTGHVPCEYCLGKGTVPDDFRNL